MSSLARERLASNRSASRSATAEPSASVVCVKCDRKLLGRLRKDGKAHAICPRRKRKRGTRKVRRPPKLGRLSKLAWEVRKGEVFLRDGGCVAPEIRILTVLGTLGIYEPPWTTGPCEGPLDVDHVIKRSKGGTDDLSNLRVLCRRHHNLRHPEKSLRWSKRSAARREGLGLHEHAV